MNVLPTKKFWTLFWIYIGVFIAAFVFDFIGIVGDYYSYDWPFIISLVLNIVLIVPIIIALVALNNGDLLYATKSQKKKIEVSSKPIDEQLVSLFNLKEKGIISEEEFAAQKSKLLVDL